MQEALIEAMQTWKAKVLNPKKHQSAQTMLNRLKRGRTHAQRKRRGPRKRGDMFP
jgi:hypothetical protein